MPSEYYPEYDSFTLPQLAEEADRLDKVIDAAEEDLRLLKLRRDHMVFHRLPEKMAEQGTQSIRLVSGRGVTLTNEVLVSVLAENREAQHEWLRDIGADSLITPTVNARSFQSFVKERLEAMQEIPEFVKVCARPRAKFLAAR